MKSRWLFFMPVLAVLVLWGWSQPAHGYWVTKVGEIDYTCHWVPPTDTIDGDGMPDFDQKQDAWRNANNQWTWCGPVATANCLWWFDSKFERIRLWSLVGNVNPTMPPAISDNYSLISAFGAWDDHDPGNVMPYIQNLVTFLPGGVVPPGGVTAQQLKTMIENYLASAAVNLWGHYSIEIVEMPDFDYVYEQVEVSQDVILLLGFWQKYGSEYKRFGGHWVTVAGVQAAEDPNPAQISFSDPIKDNAELGFPGVIWNGFIIPHNPIPGHASFVHNDAGNVSHDYFQWDDTSGSPGGNSSSPDYGYDWYYDDWTNFQGQNTPDRINPSQQANYNPSLPVHVEIEDIIVICPSFDYGDLHGSYPTFDIESCGPAHPLTDKAWLGDDIDDELFPDTLDMDNFDDGVIFHGLPWWPCSTVSVTVTVTTGAHYAGEDLYLNAWKDGNIDGDFDDGPDATEDDYLCCSEWVIQDVSVAAGAMMHTFCDPGVYNLGIYDLRMRFRLTSQQVGRFGYGGAWYFAGPNGWGVYDIDWVLGEVEDYIKREMQLPVELKSFNAMPGDGEVLLSWVTASEQDNDCFLLHRRTTSGWIEIAVIPGQGNSTSEQSYHYTDRNLRNGVPYDYLLMSKDIAGVVEELATISATPTASVVPQDYALYQNFPNPFNAATAIRFDLKERSFVDLSVFDITGRQVATLIHEELPASHQTVTFNAGELPSGIYFYRLQTASFTSTKKMVFLK